MTMPEISLDAACDPPRLSVDALPAPGPSAGMAAYIGEREKCLAASERKADNYRRYMRSRRRGIVADYLPVKLDI